MRSLRVGFLGAYSIDNTGDLLVARASLAADRSALAQHYDAVIAALGLTPR